MPLICVCKNNNKTFWGLSGKRLEGAGAGDGIFEGEGTTTVAQAKDDGGFPRMESNVTVLSSPLTP